MIPRDKRRPQLLKEVTKEGEVEEDQVAEGEAAVEEAAKATLLNTEREPLVTRLVMLITMVMTQTNLRIMMLTTMRRSRLIMRLLHITLFPT